MLRRIVTVIVPTVLAPAVGILVLIGFFELAPGLGVLSTGLVEWATIIAGFGVLVGLVNVAQTHGRRVVRLEKGWWNSLALLLSALAVLVVGLVSGIGSASLRVQWIFRYVLEPLSLTFFSLLAFFLAAAFFRSLRFRSLEAALVTITALIVLLGQVPPNPAWGFLQPFITLQSWLLRVPAMAGVRAILIGVAVGAISTGMRVILGQERPYAE